ncbi:hypothetical protein BC827DRAFT_280646 [Russula dissimulans]|nr:hypothetical protein BC827DRAFT_280646 [Russula dissimulans]
MALLSRLALRVLHFFYFLFLAIWSLRNHYLRRAPRSLTATRSKTPSHLALVLVVTESDLCASEAREAFLRCTEKAIACCRAAGIRRLSVYDRLGILLEAPQLVSERLEKCLPPAQDRLYLTRRHSDGSGVSNGGHHEETSCIKTICVGDTTDKLRKRNRGRPRIQYHVTHKLSNSETFTLHFVSRDTGKPAIAAIADNLLNRATEGLRRRAVSANGDAGVFKVTVADLQTILEGDRGYDPPDLMIVHHVTLPRRQFTPLELYSFPPWQVRLTEIQLRPRAEKWMVLSELDFRRALDEYSTAEFRLGK